MDPYWVWAAHEWLPIDLDGAGSVAERTEWLETWVGIVSFVTGRLKNAEQGQHDDDPDSLPDQFDDWVFDRVGMILVSLRDVNERRLLWQPILSLGGSLHHWVERFASNFLSLVRHATRDRTLEFVTVWREMVEYALHSPDWAKADGAPHRHAGDMWEHLLGMLGWILWDDEDAVLIGKMKDLYCEWGRHHLNSWSGSRHFVRFLRHRVASEIRLDGLVWIARVEIARFLIDDVANDLAQVLALSWAQYRSRILADTTVKESFLLLLKLLPDSPLALQIGDEMAGS